MHRCGRILLFATGLLLGAGADGAADAKVVALPPFLVEEKGQGLPWRYAAVAGLEVLSSGPERLTRTLIANHHRLHVLLGELLPPELQLRTTEKRTLLFVDSAHQPATSQEIVAQLLLTSVEPPTEDGVVPLDDGKLRRRPLPPRYTFLPNLRLWDRDAQALFAIVRESEFDAHRVGLTPEYIAYLLRNRLPALPPWFISGVLTLSARAKFTEDTLALERIDWPSGSGSAVLRGSPEANRRLLPLADFFAGELASGGQGDALSLWQAQAALFVRWGVAGRGAPRRAAFWQFAARASVESVTEELFKECFGFDFATAELQLAAFLPEAMRDTLVLRPAQRPRLPDYPVRPADEVEIARIKGDWERLEIGYVKAQFPTLAPKYLEQARRTLMRAYERGSRDARLLAVMGLCEVEAGNDAAARDYLEAAAARAPSLRPRAWYELARLRFAAMTVPRAASGPRLTPGQASEVLTPLQAANKQQPPQAEVYALIAEVWAACAHPPTRAELAVLEEGVRIFPRHTELVHRTAELNVRHGFTDTARWLITLGLKLAPDDAARTRFEALQARNDAAR
ncbi:MAG TPA: hypothetical protein VM029_19190, partial [Opitutaceae bacterium]|nr:hypothetical protein [Opitutaceae bacterium]